MAEVKRRSGGYVAWRLARGIFGVGVIFAFTAALMLAIVWGVAWVCGPAGLFHRWFGTSWPTSNLAWNGTLALVANILIFVMITATLLILAERKWSARMQNRIGPNRARFGKRQKGAMWGIPHVLADALKMIVKEDFIPPEGERFLFNLAPMMAFAPAFALMAILPVAPRISAFGTTVRFQVVSIDVGLLYLFAISSLAVYGTTLAGWSANNKFSLLGGLRASAQMVSYEVTLGLTLVGAFLLYASLRPEEIVHWQDALALGFLPKWGVFYQPFALVFFFAAAAAEVKRAPFDLPEGESEIIGYFVEYSGMKFGLFMVSEFIEIVVLSAVIVVIFFGGWSIPWVTTSGLFGALTRAIGPDWGNLLGGFIYLFVFITKTMFFVWLQMMIRWTLPRFRFDQVMDLGWKILLPLSLANVAITATAIVFDPTLHLVLGIGLVELVVLLAMFFSATIPNRETDIRESARSHASSGSAAASAH